MKTKFISILLSLALPLLAKADCSTADNLNYSVTTDEAHDFKDCVEQLREISTSQGNGYIEPLEAIGIVLTNLTNNGVEKAMRLSCVVAIEVEAPVEGHPRGGRSN